MWEKQKVNERYTKKAIYGIQKTKHFGPAVEQSVYLKTNTVQHPKHTVKHGGGGIMLWVACLQQSLGTWL